MQGQPNSKIVGATIIGFAMVAGAFTISSLQTPKQPIVQTAALSGATALRVPIPVTDTSGDGIEDWREEFVITEPLTINQESSDYTPPDTITGKMSVSLLENVLSSRIYGPFGSDDGEIIERTVSQLQQESMKGKLFDTPDIIIMDTWDDEDIRNYANTIASIVIQRSAGNEDTEIELLYEYTRTKDPALLKEITEIATAFSNHREDTLKVPVPAFLIKDHLDLINTYQAIYEGISTMVNFEDDPAYALIRLKRYVDDARGLSLVFENMYNALVPYASVFEPNDPALLLAQFSPDFQR